MSRVAKPGYNGLLDQDTQLEEGGMAPEPMSPRHCDRGISSDSGQHVPASTYLAVALALHMQDNIYKAARVRGEGEACTKVLSTGVLMM